MPTTSTPTWSAVRNGLNSDPGATMNATGVNQLLGSHASTEVYAGASVVGPRGTGATPWGYSLSTVDISQSFPMSGTSMGRVTVPVLPVGQGADLLVSLCANNSGSPGAVLNQTRIPASFITQLAASDGLDVSGPLGTSGQNALRYGVWQSVPWAAPSSTGADSLDSAQLAQSGPYLVFAGGVTSGASGASLATVNVVTWTGGSALSAPMPGPSLPQPLLSGRLAISSDTLCYVGGVNTTGVSPVVQSTVYTAAWNSSTGAVGAWASQTALPQALVDPGFGIYEPTSTVYVVGGSTNYAPESNFVTTVYYANVQSQQITGWSSAVKFPIPIADPTVAVIGNQLIVVGGYTTGFVANTAVYYAQINPATGVPGAWVPGPPIPDGLYVEGQSAISDAGIAWPQAFNPATGTVVQDMLTLSWGVSGPGIWTHQVCPLTVENKDQIAAMVSTSAGVYQMFSFQASSYLTASVLTIPVISVPLPTSGLTSGLSYQILMQQIGGDLSDYLQTLTDFDVFTGNPTAVTSPRGANTWTAAVSGNGVPVQIYSQTAGGPVLHTWEDSGARISTIVRTTTPDLSVLGLCESVTQPGLPLNQVWNFENSLGQWTASGGAVTASSAHSFQQLTRSAQVTPNGSSAQCYIQSGDFVPVLQGHTYTATGVIYTAVGYTQCSVNINWYAANHTFISTTSGTPTSIPSNASATLTVSSSGSMPTNAAYAEITLMEAGTPPSSAVFFAFIGALTDNLGGSYANVSQVTYNGAWPAYIGPPTAILQLA